MLKVRLKYATTLSPSKLGCANTAPIPTLLASVSSMKGSDGSDEASMGASPQGTFKGAEGLLALCSPTKLSVFSQQACERSSDGGKPSHKSAVVGRQPQEALYLLF